MRNTGGKVLREEEHWLKVPALCAVWMDEVLLSTLNIYEEYISYALYENDMQISSSSVILSVPKFFHYENPQLSCTVEGDEIVVWAKGYAKSVEILNGEEDLILSDNYFDMDGGEKRVKILSGRPENLKLRSVFDIR